MAKETNLNFEIPVNNLHVTLLIPLFGTILAITQYTAHNLFKTTPNQIILVIRIWKIKTNKYSLKFQII